MNYSIGEAAELSGISAKMIRYYESMGLMPEPNRTEAGYRKYEENDIHNLRFILRARDLGFSVKQIRELLDLWRDRERASSEVKALASGHLVELRRKLREMEMMVDTLQHLVKNCHGDDRPDCPILGELGRDQLTRSV